MVKYYTVLSCDKVTSDKGEFYRLSLKPNVPDNYIGYVKQPLSAGAVIMGVLDAPNNLRVRDVTPLKSDEEV